MSKGFYVSVGERVSTMGQPPVECADLVIKSTCYKCGEEAWFGRSAFKAAKELGFNCICSVCNKAFVDAGLTAVELPPFPQGVADGELFLSRRAKRN